jgi:STE24 endopeptidase
VSRLLLLFICLIWMAGISEPAVRGLTADTSAVLAHLTTLPVMVLFVAVWSRWASRRVTGNNFVRTARTLGWLMFCARGLIVVWFAGAVFYLGWPAFVLDTIGLGRWEYLRLPGLFVGTLPVMLTWVALWWAQYPADQALRFQGLADNLLAELPVHSPPAMGEWLLSTVRLQLLFTVLPVMLIAATHDVLALSLFPAMDLASLGHLREQVDGVLWLLSAAAVFLLAPEVLRRVLKTKPLADSPLRRRLEFLCRRSGITCRDILVWDTHYNVGNAAVMGLMPRFRYVLLSDLLLDRMGNEQIEAVFAHEVGHVVHRHMAWYVVFFMILIFLAAGPGALAVDLLHRVVPIEQGMSVALLFASTAAVCVMFGFVSRRFERQADVYAARMMESIRPADASVGAAALGPLLSGNRPAAEPPAPPIESHVGVYGSNLFSSALHKVATINNLPVAPRSRSRSGLVGQVSYAIGNLVDLAHDWLHGSIASRMEYLRTLSADPSLTGRFDRMMTRLYSALLFVLVASAAYTLPGAFR